jgi:hypothetical protein
MTAFHFMQEPAPEEILANWEDLVIALKKATPSTPRWFGIIDRVVGVLVNERVDALKKQIDLRAPPASVYPPASFYPNQPIFDAICAATRISGGAIVIDVTAFLLTLTQHRDLELARPAIEACWGKRES